MDLKKESVVVLQKFSLDMVGIFTRLQLQVFCNTEHFDYLPLKMLGNNVDNLLQRSYRRKRWLFQKKVPPIAMVLVNLEKRMIETPGEVSGFLTRLSLVLQSFQYPQCLPVISGDMFQEVSALTSSRIPISLQIRLFETAKEILLKDLCGMDFSRFFARVGDHHPTHHLYPLDPQEAAEDQGIQILHALFRECDEGTQGCVPIVDSNDFRPTYAEMNKNGDLSRDSRIGLFQKAISAVYTAIIVKLEMPIVEDL